ncbi:DUF500-domain-containing protein [Guyanagaster necrorhizus]|uniref:DUF500-domain-containing protein n=1 Tax=Guyanagaster necrorhizus TaxID=856835 RepID=A0A9P7VZU8_9AGAR|nr:DUF500-domain-containing protein [Guyanagaster necrorhizus MCA 3950]KAG7450178.1 DUF500-domain-containing protein [Guyanagaster necrorhizus MCA 3950]
MKLNRSVFKSRRSRLFNRLGSPVPQSLPKECAKAASIFKSFVDSGNDGLDGVIPRRVLENAKGFAIFTIFKAGFLFSARAGSGIVIARLDDGTWSCPSAIGTAGVGFGGQAGAEMTDFLIVLNSRSVNNITFLKSFMAAGSLTLGGNMSLAVGPLGRNGEAVGSLNTSGKVAAMYSYSKTRGLFGGLSVEGSIIVERQDANVQAYNNPNVTAKLLLSGAISQPPWIAPLIQTLEACTGLPGNRQWIEDSVQSSAYAFGGVGSTGTQTPSYLKKKKTDKPIFPPESWGQETTSGSYFTESDPPSNRYNSSNFASTPNSTRQRGGDTSMTTSFPTHFDSDFMPEDSKRPTHRISQSLPYATKAQATNDWFDSLDEPKYSGLPGGMYHARSMSLASPTNSKPSRTSYDSSASIIISPKPELSKPLLEGVARAIALYNFNAVEPGDLSFNKGDVIVILHKSNSSDDWWTGKIGDRKGIFPANFVEVV